jgi:ABC-type dipeptide/oligopeptide/nickel transport system permease subunit
LGLCVPAFCIQQKQHFNPVKTSVLLSRIWLALLFLGLLFSWLLDIQPGRIPNLPNSIPPGSAQALLGTDHLGRNIALGLLHGIPSMLILAIPALLISLFFALTSAFLLARNIIPRLPILNLGLGLVSGLILLASLPWLPVFPFWLLLSLAGLFFAACCIPLPGPSLSLFLPTLIRMLQLILLSIPGMLLLFSINPNSYLELIFLLGGTSWVALGQFSERSMIDFFRSTEFENARSLGIPMFRILHRHLFRRLLQTLRPQLAWLLAGFIVIEGSLGYLGVGLPSQHWGWGQMLRLGLLHSNLWWSWLFPSFCILFTVLSVFVLLQAGRKSGELSTHNGS